MLDKQLLFSFIDLCIKLIALVIGFFWTMIKLREYREFKNWLQFDVHAEIMRLREPETAALPVAPPLKGQEAIVKNQLHTHAVETRLTIANKGRTRAKIYNIQLGINTMREPGKAKADPGNCRLILTRMFTSGNLVPLFEVEGQPVAATSYYYIEPGVEQTVSFLCLIPEPRELLQISARFNLEQERLFPELTRKKGGLYPHTVTRTYHLPAMPAPENQH